MTTSPNFTEPAPDGRAIAALAAAMLLASLGVSVVNVALPALSAAFGVPLPAVQWLVLGYLLALTVATPAAGRLGDAWGARRLLVWALGTFAVSSVLAAAAPVFPVLLASRIGQGLAAAVIMALVMALVRDAVPRSRTGRAMGLLGTMSAVGTALGPSLGGVLLGAAGWRAIFAVMVPLALGAAILAARHLPRQRPDPTGAAAIDVVGIATLALALGAYALALTWGGGAISPANGVLLLTAAAAGLLYARTRRGPAPDGTLMPFLAANALVSTVMMATLVVGPFYLSGALHLGDAAVGMVMAAGPAVAALSGVPAGRLTDWFGATATAIAGLVLMALAALGLAVLPGLFGVAGYLAALVCLTPGYQLFQAANNTAVMMDVAADRRGGAGAALSLSRNLGLITGASLMGAVFARATGTPDVAHAAPGALGTGLTITFALAGVLVLAALAAIARNARRRTAATTTG